MNSVLSRLVQHDGLNFVLTNRIPRRWLTRLVGRISKSEHPLIAKSCMALWRAFAEVDLNGAARTDFRSMHDCFTRALKPDARPIDAEPAALTSPCDGIVGASGRIEDLTLVQAKHHKYTLPELLCDEGLANQFRNGSYTTLRLTSGMYHRFHSPHDARITRVTYVSGDTWNVNPPTLSRVAKLFCHNERAVLQLRLMRTHHQIVLVPVAAILVASIRLHFLNVLLHLDYTGPHVMDVDAGVGKGEEMGWFEHGSTIIVLAPEGFELCSTIQEGHRVRMGESLMQLPQR